MNAHAVCGFEEFHYKAVLHQRLATTYRQPSRHDLESAPILAKLFDRSINRHWNSVGQSPRIGVVAIKAAELTTSCPSNDTNTGAIDRRASRKRMQKSHVPSRQGSSDIRFRHVTSEIYSKLKGAFALERWTLRMLSCTHGFPMGCWSTGRGTC